MTETIFFRLIESDDKEAALSQAIQQLTHNQQNSNTFKVEPESFRKVPNAPFAYWVGNKFRLIFTELSPLESSGIIARQGLVTGDDFRFIRASWEVGEDFICPVKSHPITPLGTYCLIGGYTWFPLVKGGAYSLYRGDIHLVVNWRYDGDEIRNLFDLSSTRSLSRPQNTNFYFSSGVVWSRRSQRGLSFRTFPKGSIFSDKGPTIFTSSNDPLELLTILAITNSTVFFQLVKLQMAFGSYEVGVIQRTPLPTFTSEFINILSRSARQAWSLKGNIYTVTQTSHAFILPALLQFKGKNLAERAQAWANHVAEIETKLTQIQAEIDALVFDLYGIDERDRLTIGNAPVNSEENESDDDDEDNDAISDPLSLTQEMIAYALGVAIGRFDVRLATGERPHPPEPEPLPICSPGMLVGESGLPPTTADELPIGYPIQIPFNGIIVDDEGHPNDIINRVRDVLKVIWGDRDGDIEQEACEILKVSSLRDYFRKPALFFNTHLSRYSKSRRQAPIYLPLSTRSGSYTIWLYYHRLTDQTLYTCINDYIEPKLLRTRDLTSQLRNQTDRTSSETKQLETLQDLEAELTELRDELLRVAQLPFKPNLNDGVQITVAPLWQLFRLPKWQKKLKETWDKLEQGEYDWAHLAYSIWSERVRAKCKTDKSLAIAHDLESLYEPPPEKPKSSSKKKRKTAE
jgi:hypothetical protein